MKTTSSTDDVKSIATRLLQILAEDEQGIASWHMAVRDLGRQLHAATAIFVAEGRTDPEWPLPEGLRWATDVTGQLCIVGEPRTQVPALALARHPGVMVPYGEFCTRDDADALTDLLLQRIDAQERQQ